ncbi:MAG TPA: hypothetical protein GYA06_02960 [Chloroflexi bacterium]|nr:hypothetical protein [Chloroflexota bacterium]
MSAGKIIGFIVAALLILFGALMVLGATDQAGQIIWLPIGLVFILIGLVIIFFVARKPPQVVETNVTYQVDLPANVNMDTLKCESCGGVLSKDDIKMVSGAPVVTCPYCGTVYQITEEPKW